MRLKEKVRDFITSDNGQVFKLESFWESRSLLNIYQTFERATNIYFIRKVNWIKVTKHERVTVTYHKVFKVWWHQECLNRDKATLYNGRKAHLDHLPKMQCPFSLAHALSICCWPSVIKLQVTLRCVKWSARDCICVKGSLYDAQSTTLLFWHKRNLDTSHTADQ